MRWAMCVCVPCVCTLSPHSGKARDCKAAILVRDEQSNCVAKIKERIEEEKEFKVPRESNFRL